MEEIELFSKLDVRTVSRSVDNKLVQEVIASDVELAIMAGRVAEIIEVSPAHQCCPFEYVRMVTSSC